MPNFAQRAFLGYNNRLSPFDVPDDTLTDAFDVVLEKFRSLTKSNGFSTFNATAISSSEITALYRHYEGTGVGTSNKEMLARSGTRLDKFTDATGATTQVTVNGAALLDARAQFATFEDLAIFTNSTNAVKKYSIGSTGEDLGGSPPTSDFIAIHFERIWLARNSRLSFSDVSAPETYGASSFIEVGEGDGDQITGIRRGESGLIIWKNHSIWILYGNSINSFTLAKISDNIGCTAPHSISEANGRYYFLARDGIYSTVGSRPVLESFPIQPDVDDISQAAITDVFGFSHKNKWYVMSYQSSANTDTNNKRIILMDTRLRGLNDPGQGKSSWTKLTGHKINAAANWDAGDDEGETFFGASDDGLVFEFDDGTTHAGTNFGPKVKTKFYGDEIERVYDLFYLDLEADSGGVLTVDYETNQPPNGGAIVFNLATLGAKFGSESFGSSQFGSEGTREFKGGFRPNAVGRYIQFTMTQTASELPLTIRGFNMTFWNQPAYV